MKRKYGDLESFWSDERVQYALAIAFTAHGAKGQTRADGKTPYIVHPKRVAQLSYFFTLNADPEACGTDKVIHRVIGALLHDVMEDTSLTDEDLSSLGIDEVSLDIAKRLTKPDPHGAAPPEYYQGIAESEDALYVKCADRCANLEDALAELLVEEPKEPRRWGRYVEDTYTHVLPLYTNHTYLRKEIEGHLAKIEEALPAALERRAKVVERQRSKNASNNGDRAKGPH